jgi:hypothetical protein
VVLLMLIAEVFIGEVCEDVGHTCGYLTYLFTIFLSILFSFFISTLEKGVE